MPEPPVAVSNARGDEEPPPIFSTWGRFYGAILVWEALTILMIAAVSAWPFRR